jgi:hypothetical protein
MILTEKGNLFDQTSLHLATDVKVEKDGDFILVNGSMLLSHEYVLTKNKLSSLSGGWTVTW